MPGLSGGGTDVVTLEPPAVRERLRVFLSYARADEAAVHMVEDGLRTLHYQVWVDSRLDGGQLWWDEILGQIRNSDAMIVAVSPSLLDSEAATLEREYALRLGKQLLPVLVAPLPAELLPQELAPLQLIDYTSVSPASAFRLAGAMATLPPAPPLPDPLPEPPAVPISYMTGLADRVRAPVLSLSEQLQLVGELRTALERPRERPAAVQLMERLESRRDLYHAPWTELTGMLARERERSADNRGLDDAADADTEIPPGWYPDPSRRHQSRWFDGDWTRYAADGGRVIDDPDF